MDDLDNVRNWSGKNPHCDHGQPSAPCLLDTINSEESSVRWTAIGLIFMETACDDL